MTTDRVALFLPHLGGGGAERAMVELARGLAARSVSVDLVVVRAEGPFVAAVPPSVRLVELRASRMLSAAPRLVRYLRTVRPAALLSTLSYANVMAVWAARVAGVGTRVVVREANTLSVATRQARHAKERLIQQLVRRAYPRADAVVAVSDGVASDLARLLRLPRSRIEVVYNPVVTRELEVQGAAPLEHPWFAPGEPPVVLGVGRLIAQKDFPTLVRAFARVRQLRAARLMILGEGAERQTLQALAGALGVGEDTALPGFVANPFQYMTRCGVFVLSSSWEGLPGVLIQAMACGARVVSTDCESGPREILEGGRFGALVPVGDVDALAQAIDAALGTSPPVLPREALSRFAEDEAVGQYLQVLRGGRDA